jgi:hypothetical protein
MQPTNRLRWANKTVWSSHPEAPQIGYDCLVQKSFLQQLWHNEVEGVGEWRDIETVTIPVITNARISDGQITTG